MNAIEKRPGETLLGDLLPYLSFDNGCLWLKDGSATKTFRVNPKNCMSFTEEELEILRSGISSTLSQVPENTFIQFLMIREKTNQESDLACKNWEKTHTSEASMGESNTLFEAKKTALENLWDSERLFQTKIYVTIRISPFIKSKAQTGAFAHIAFNRNAKMSIKNQVLIKEETEQVFSTLKLGFEAAGFETIEPTQEELFKILFRFINPDRKNFSAAPSNAEVLSDALGLSDLIESKRCLKFGRTELRIGTLKALPETSIPCLMSGFATLGKAFALVLTVLILPQTEERERLARKQRLTQGMASGNSVRNLYAETQLQDIEETMSAMISSGDKLLASSFHTIVFDEVA